MQQHVLPLCNASAHRGGHVATGRDLAQQFTFYATFDVDSLCSFIPEQTALLLPASSWSRKGMKKPPIPAHITEVAADSGGFVASRVWGDYRYTLEQYVTWLQSWQPRWAAMMDYCCEPQLQQVTRRRQEQTTANAREAWSRYQQVPWAWVPTVQGWIPEDYSRHASELQPLIEEMRTSYHDHPSWRVGIGTLCQRNDVTMIQAIVDAVREVLPRTPLHLWGIKLDALCSVNLDQVVSTDSAVWHGAMYARQEIAQAAHEAGMSMRAYQVKVRLPAYVAKVHAAVEESRRVACAQGDTMLLQQARAILKAQGWTIHLRTRRNRAYVYAARRTGERIEQRYLCAVSELSAWLSVVQRTSS